MRKLSLRAACLRLVAILGLGWSATASCLTIDSALNSAYNNNPKFKALRLDRQNFATKVFGAMPSVLPKVALGHEVQEKTKWALEWDVSLGALMKPSEEYTSAQSSIYNSLEQERKLVQEGAALYLDLYQTQQTLRAAKAKLDLAKKQLELTRARFAMGDATAGQIAIAEANYSSSEVEHEKSKSNIECKSEEFKNFFVIRDEKVPQLSAPEKSSNAPESLEKAIELALESDYGIAAKSKEIEASKRKLRSSILKNTPEAKFKISNTFWEKSKATPDKKPSFELSLGIKTLAPDVLAENIIKKRELRKACLELQSYKADLSNRVLKLWSAYRIAKMECASAQASFDATHASFVRAQREHGLGKGSLLDLCKAEQELENARLSQVKANVEYEKTLREMLSLCAKRQTSKKSK